MSDETSNLPEVDDSDEEETEQHEEKHLGWGETPFDGLSPDEVLKHAHRMLIALGSLHSVVRVAKTMDMQRGDTANPYWGVRGVGGAALERGDQIFAMLNEGIDPDQHEPYHSASYYRYAEDLLFDTTKHEMIGDGWRVCDSCHCLMGSKERINDPCSSCGKPTHLLTWDDLRPVVEPKEGTSDVESGEVPG